jgi:1-deoxy-D-xylulose-5-phosphate synthase
VGEDGETHMGLYYIAYMLAVPEMTVTAPKDGAEMLGLLRTAVLHRSGPFSIRYPRDAAPDKPASISTIDAVPYATWEVLRKGSEVALFAVGTMVQPALAAADTLAAEGLLTVRTAGTAYDEITLGRSSPTTSTFSSWKRARS